MLKNRVAKLEQAVAVKQLHQVQRVFIAHQNDSRNQMDIPGLEFSGTIEAGRQLMEAYPYSTFIIDDIPRAHGEVL